MPFDISKYAKGLPSLLGFKERGRGPPVFADNVVGIADVRDLYLLNDRVLETSAVNVAPAVGSNSYPTPFLVPAGELWYVWSYACVANAGAGGQLTFCAGVKLDGLNFSAPLTLFISVPATQSIRTGPLVRPFWAGPGTEFTFIVQTVAATPDITGLAIVSKLKV
jgi:hypothetical protein